TRSRPRGGSSSRRSPRSSSASWRRSVALCSPRNRHVPTSPDREGPMMSWLRGLWLRLRYYLFRARYDREMEDEMRFHLELRAAEHEHDGMSATEARDAALRRFGN